MSERDVVYHVYTLSQDKKKKEKGQRKKGTWQRL